MTKRASGTFEVKLTPMPSEASVGPAVGRMTLEKQFQGEMIGSIKGQMLAVRTAVDDSAGYVALEVVQGSVHGLNGTFVLQHSGTMNRGAQGLVVAVVPDSGTGELEGLSGALQIIIRDGKHFYELDYAISES